MIIYLSLLYFALSALLPTTFVSPYSFADEYQAYASSTYGVLNQGRCSICLAEGRKSVVYPDPTTSVTLMYCGGGHYDESGKYFSPEPCNQVTYRARCSNGHNPAWYEVG